VNQLFEVEQKFRVDTHEGLVERLQTLDAVAMPEESHCDTYLQHPCRDFAQSGEAFRLRRINGLAMATYKGPRLAGTVKIRQELEVPLAKASFDNWMEILTELGFQIVANVEKKRLPFQVAWEGIDFFVVLDTVVELGSFVEIETIAYDSSQLESSQHAIHSLAERLGLVDVEARSYLRQIVERK
jgi:adenylate cyclase class 2